MNTTSLYQLANDLVSATANGIYQGLALVALLWIAFKLLRRTNASTRYAAAFLTLLAIAALPIAHLALPGAGPLPPETKPTAPAPSAVATLSAKQAPAPFAKTIASPTQSPHQLREAFSANASQNAPTSYASTSPDTISSPTPSRIHWRTTLPDSVAIGLVCGWFSVAAILLSRLGYQYILLHRLKHRSDPPEPALAAAFQSLRQQVLPARPIRLLISDRLSTPLAAGLGDPTVILPKTLCDSTGAAELEGVLFHELAHLRRRDDWTNLFQQIIHCTLFFHPALWWISRRLTVDREIACDDHVLAQTRRPKTYALLLTQFAGQRQTQTWAAAPAAWINTNQLKERIGMILDKSRNASPRLARGRLGSIVAGAFALAIIATLIGPRVALATASPEGDALPPVGSERKIKDDARAHSGDRATGIPSASAPAAAPTPAATPAPTPRPHRLPRPSPRAAEENRAVSNSNDRRKELEQRVAELQRLIETLVEERLQTDVNVDPQIEVHPHLENMERHLKHLENFDWDGPPSVHHNFDFHFDQEAHEHAMKEAERAMEEGVKAYEKAIENVRALAEAQAKNQLESHERQNALRDGQRSALEKQRARLERQLAHLEQQRERLHQQIEGLESQLNHLDSE